MTFRDDTNWSKTRGFGKDQEMYPSLKRLEQSSTKIYINSWRSGRVAIFKSVEMIVQWRTEKLKCEKNGRSTDGWVRKAIW